MSKRKRTARPEPIEPSRFGVGKEPWARWTSGDFFTPLLHRRSLRIPGPPILPVFVIAAVFGGLLGLLFWLGVLLGDHPDTLLELVSWLLAALAGRIST